MDRRYSSLIQTFQKQCKNETLTPNYSLAQLTMTEIKIQLYTIDKNSSTSRHLAHQTCTKQAHLYKKSQRAKLIENQKFDLSQIRCYKCNNMGHYTNKCPLKQNKKRQ